MRYIILGAGAVGGVIGGRLAASGHDVVLVARGDHLNALRAGGLRLSTPDESLTLAVPAVGGPDEVELWPGDVLVLAVKTQDTVAVLDAWAHRPVAGGGTAAGLLPVVCAQNGVENERLALRRFRHVYAMCVWLPATHLEPGAVSAEAAPKSGALRLGRYPAGVDATAERIAADLRGSVFLSEAVPDVMRWKYAKLLGNLGNAVDAVCGRAPGLEDVFDRVRAEGVAVLAAAGIDHVTGEEERAGRDLVQVRPVAGVERSGGSSWQSLARGTGSIEADHLNGEVALLGRLHGVSTPVNDVLQRVANGFARDRRAPGSLSLAELEELIAAG